MADNSELKSRVHSFWNEKSCGELHAVTEDLFFDLTKQANERYRLEPYIFDFAKFHDGTKKDILEIGVGMGADHVLWARSGPQTLCGIDLTTRALKFTSERLVAEGLRSNLSQGDAEKLPFDNESFDIVYSWGVLHHSPDTPRCVAEVARVLRRGGTARVMIYHKWSLVGLMLWLRYGLLLGHPRRSLEEIYFSHLESPGTKAYSSIDAQRMFRTAGFSQADVRVQLSHGDLLLGNVGTRHRGALLNIATALWPRWLLRRLATRMGLYLLIEAIK